MIGGTPRDDEPIARANTEASSVEPPDALVLADGRRLRLRPMGAHDRDGLAALFARLSPESRLRRFLSPKVELTPHRLSHLTDVDHINHEAVAAVDQRDGSIVGVARYVRDANRPTVADVAVEVADELQGMGIGTTLVRHTMKLAQANGVGRLTATTMWDNGPARALLHRSGFKARGSHAGVIELELELESPSAHRAVRACKASNSELAICQCSGLN